MNQWFIQDAFMLTNGMVVGAIIFLCIFLLLFWQYMALLGDYNALMTQKIRNIEHSYWKWVTYEKPIQTRRREEKTGPSEVSEDSVREA